jgi:fatty-acyl-CoA synthase
VIVLEAQTLFDTVWGWRDDPRTLVTLITPDGEQLISAKTFFDNAVIAAVRFAQAGVKQGDLVVIVLDHSAAVLYAFWGALLIGAVPSIFPFLSDKLQPAHYYESVRALVEHSQVRAVFTEGRYFDGLAQALDGLDAPLINNSLITTQAVEGHIPFVHPNPADTAFLQHSSGSTGLQKGVMLSHQSVLNQIRAYSQAIRLSSDDVIVSWLPLYHDMGLIAGFVMPLVTGVRLVLMSPFHWVRDPKILLHAITQHRATLCWLPNFAYNFLATRIPDKALAGVDLSSMRAFVNCSEPVYADSHRVFAQRFIPYGLREVALTTCYAMAENTFAVTQAGIDAPVRLDLVDRKTLMEERKALPHPPTSSLFNGEGESLPTVTLVSNGQPIPNCRVRIVDEATGADLPERRVGEIALQSDSMLTGYYNRHHATAEALRDGWYFTGDMGYLADGELYITGRKKDLIIVAGKNIYPQDVENLLNDVPDVHPGRVVAFGVPNAELGTEDVGVIVEVSDAAILTDDERRGAILREIRARVAQHTDVMARYVYVAEPMWLIKTSSGKIARRINRERYLREVLGQG